VFERCW